MAAEHPKPPVIVRKLIVEVIKARDLLPKDGQGSSSPYVVAEFDGQKRRTSVVERNLNPVWNESLEFIVSDPKTMEFEEVCVEMYNDKKLSHGTVRKDHFLGRVKLYGSQIVKRGEEGLVFFIMEKRSVFSWVRGDLGLKIYYYDEIIEEQTPPPEPASAAESESEAEAEAEAELEEQLEAPEEEMKERVLVDLEEPPTMTAEPREHTPPTMTAEPREHTPPTENMPPPRGFSPEVRKMQIGSNGMAGFMARGRNEEQLQAPEEEMKKPVLVDLEEPPAMMAEPREHTPPSENMPPPRGFSPEVREMQTGSNGMAGFMDGERVKVIRPELNEDYSPRIIAGKLAGDKSEGIPAFDLVEPMQHLFVRIVKARALSPNVTPHVKIRTSGHFRRSRAAVIPPGSDSTNPEWNQVFALGYNKETASNSTLEISVWDGSSEKFLGGVCFDLSDVPLRDPRDSPLAPQWYHLDGAASDQNQISGDLQLSVWIGTQADEALPDTSSSLAPQPSVSYTRPKVYQSPKLWYLRVTVIEAQDLRIIPNLPPLTAPDIRIKGQLGFQSVHTKRCSMSHNTSAVHWKEDLLFVAGEPLEDSLILLVEDRTTGKDPTLLGHVLVPVQSIEQRIDERRVGAKWYSLEGGPVSSYNGRLHLRIVLEGGYHVLDEAAQYCSDFRPTAKNLWKPAIGILELGILGARGLSPMKSKSNGKGSTDSYCVVRYGEKWVRTRTIRDSFDPRWNEQYTWQVYDPSTVVTVGVFDNCRMFANPGEEEEEPDCYIGKIRIRLSTLERNKVYMNSYPLMVLQRSGLKKLGEIELVVRFVCPAMFPDTCAIYGQPLLPRMHYLQPLGVAQQEALHGAATKMVSAWLARSEPPLGAEVVKYILDVDSDSFSMRKSKANWYRILAVLDWAIGFAKWLDHIRRWRNPITTILFHVLYLVLAWYPGLIVPTGFLYVFLIGVWHYRFKPKIPSGMDVKLSQAEHVDPDDLDEEFDTFPSSRPPEVIRIRYDRLRILAAKVQTVLGDFATQGERIQALISWRDPRATKLFIGVCFAITIILSVVPPKMVAVALGFYFLRHPMFRDPMPQACLSFFRRLPGLSDKLI